MNDFAFQLSIFISILQWLDFSLELSSNQAPHTRERFSSWSGKLWVAAADTKWWEILQATKINNKYIALQFSPGFPRDSGIRVPNFETTNTSTSPIYQIDCLWGSINALPMLADGHLQHDSVLVPFKQHWPSHSRPVNKKNFSRQRRDDS